MSNKWSKETAQNINKDGVPCHINFYPDGVQPHDISGNNVKPITCTKGNISDELIKQKTSVNV